MKWIKEEIKIRNSHKGPQVCAVQLNYPDVENSLHNEYGKLHQKGLKIKG